MAATKTVLQLTNPLQPRCGVLTLYGYGISVRVDRGHLLVEDGIGSDRHQARFPRVGHGLRRLVVIGSDGIVSLAALRWLAEQNASFIMLERDGTVLAVTGPVRPSDARLRRAQALAGQNGIALEISRELITAKLQGQETLAREKLKNITTANVIGEFRQRLSAASNLEMVRALESQAAAAYWSAWYEVPIQYPRVDLPRVPEHWKCFGTRKSPLTGSPRLAVNPPGAILNYCYALLESEARLAVSALGLDPGIGFLHVDTPNRDSLACDLMEAVRPAVDAWLLDWIMREPFRRSWFFETPTGNCRLMGPFAAKLSETNPTWGRLVAPYAERIATLLWSGRQSSGSGPATRLTQRRKREAKGRPSFSPVDPAPRPRSTCRVCGTEAKPGRKYCAYCAADLSARRLAKVSRQGRVAAHSPAAGGRRAKTQRRQALARWKWRPSNQPAWLSEKVYSRKIQPQLARVANSAIATALGVSLYYAAEIRRSRRRPHPRHWQALAELVDFRVIS
jgi:CRISPR-associated endonuclease Cas1